MTKRKKIIVLSCMIALLITTAVLNFVLSSSVLGDTTAEVVTTANYFTEIRTTRNSSRVKQIEQIDEIIASSEEGSQTKADALTMKLKLSEITEKTAVYRN